MKAELLTLTEFGKSSACREMMEGLLRATALPAQPAEDSCALALAAKASFYFRQLGIEKPSLAEAQDYLKTIPWGRDRDKAYACYLLLRFGLMAESMAEEYLPRQAGSLGKEFRMTNWRKEKHYREGVASCDNCKHHWFLNDDIDDSLYCTLRPDADNLIALAGICDDYEAPGR